MYCALSIHVGFNISEALFFADFPAVLNVAAAVAELVVTYTVFLKEGKNVVHSGLSDIVQGLFGKECLM